MRIRSNLRWFTATGFFGMAIFAAVAFMVLLRIEVNGPRLPANFPEQGSGLRLRAPFGEPSASSAHLRQDERNLRSSGAPALPQPFSVLRRKISNEKYANYMRRVPEGKLKDMMRGTAYQTAEQYFKLCSRNSFRSLPGRPREGEKDARLDDEPTLR